MKKFLHPLQIGIFTMLITVSTSLTAFADYPTGAATNAPNKIITAKEFTSTDGNFGIMFPGTPTASTTPIKSGNESVTMHIFTYAPTNVNKMYVMGYTDLLKTPLSKKDAYEFLKGEEKGELDGLKIKSAAQQRQTNYKGNPGFYYRAHGEDLYLTTQTYIVGLRVYQIQMLAQKAYPTAKEIKDFIGSFRLLKTSVKNAG